MVVERRASLVCGPDRGSLGPNQPPQPTAGRGCVMMMSVQSARRGSAARRSAQQERQQE